MPRVAGDTGRGVTEKLGWKGFDIDRLRYL